MEPKILLKRLLVPGGNDDDMYFPRPIQTSVQLSIGSSQIVSITRRIIQEISYTEGTTDPVVFSPIGVLLGTQAERLPIMQSDDRSRSIASALAFIKNNNMLGISVPASTIVSIKSIFADCSSMFV